jgi:enoyl-CoA hydratase
MIAGEAAIDASSVLVERTGSLAHIRLNRPKALNSLTLDMVRKISGALDDFEADPRIATVLLTGEGDRGLCAGGDIRALYESGRAGTDLAATFWREEYRLNARIKNFSKPYVAIMDGITMGGGVGLSAHGSHRIATERTRLAMPETGIGFFPDVGGSWLLARSPGEFGTYLGLTGEHIGASDAIYAGLADLYLPISAMPHLQNALETLPSGAADNNRVRKILDSFAMPLEATVLQQCRNEIDHIFTGDRIETILEALAQSRTEFAAKTRTVLLGKSPTSMKLALRLIRLAGASTSLEQCLNREFAAGLRLLAGHDFYEGVRAAVIDKDRNPRWSPTDLDEIKDSDIAAYLVPAPDPVFPGPI